MTSLRVLHNVTCDADGRLAAFTRFGQQAVRDGDDFAEVFSCEAPSDLDDLTACEWAFRIFNVDVEMLAGAERQTAETYRARRLRSLSTGDVVCVAERPYSCETLGFAPLGARITVERRGAVHALGPLSDS